MSTSTDIELRLHVAVLHRTIRRRGWAFRDLEDELGWVRGTLTAMGRNPETVRFEDVLEVLAAIGVEPRDFFREIAMESARRSMAAEVGSAPRSAGRHDRGAAGWFRRVVSALRLWLPGS